MTTNPVFDNPQAFKLARQATLEAQRELNETPRHLLDPGNPNHPDNFDVKLFGYETNAFLAKQYKS